MATLKSKPKVSHIIQKINIHVIPDEFYYNKFIDPKNNLKG